MTVYIWIVEDGNGRSDIVSFWLVASEDRTTVKQMADLVVSHNMCVRQVHAIVGDKDSMSVRCWPRHSLDNDVDLTVSHGAD